MTMNNFIIVAKLFTTYTIGILVIMAVAIIVGNKVCDKIGLK